MYRVLTEYYIIYTIHYTLNSVQYTLYNIHYTVYKIQDLHIVSTSHNKSLHRLYEFALDYYTIKIINLSAILMHIQLIESLSC